MASQVKSGKAFEFTLLNALYNLLRESKINVNVVDNKSLEYAMSYYAEFSKAERKAFDDSAKAAAAFFPDVEPMLFYQKGDSCIDLSLAPDSKGQKGDVRDILIQSSVNKWAIGISAKNNHKAVKHPRLSPSIDFGKSWLDLPVSNTYFDNINPLFSKLKAIKANDPNTKWSEIGDIQQDFYLPILKHFKTELLRLSEHNKGVVPAKLIAYLIGRQDFYKVIKTKGMITIQAFNFQGTLNLSSPYRKPSAKIPKLNLPDRIIDLSFKRGSKSTLELTMSNGWQISFRIHNASSKIEPSFKFDINLISTPESLFSTNIHV
jgi:hypothetical protein